VRLSAGVGRGPKSLKQGAVWALLELDQPIFAPIHSQIIASRLDFDVHTSDCRVAFHGKMLCALPKRKNDNNRCHPRQLCRQRLRSLRPGTGRIEPGSVGC
jgi:hypothetical protein